MESRYLLKGYTRDDGVVSISEVKADGLRHAKEQALYALRELPKNIRKPIKNIWLEQIGGRKIRI